MTNNTKNFKELGKAFGFNMVEMDGMTILQSKDTDGEYTDWLKYNAETDTLIIVGNTDYLNIWLHETRPDLTPEKLVEFNNRLNEIMQFNKKLELGQYVDREDWQEIADVCDAGQDERWRFKKAA